MSSLEQQRKKYYARTAANYEQMHVRDDDEHSLAIKFMIAMMSVIISKWMPGWKSEELSQLMNLSSMEKKGPFLLVQLYKDMGNYCPFQTIGSIPSVNSEYYIMRSSQVQ